MNVQDFFYLCNLFVFFSILNSSQGYHKLSPIPDPCLPLGLHHKSADRVHHETYFVGLGDYNKCKMNLLPLLNLTVPCQKQPCSMNGIYQANINFSNSEFYGFSEFWYSMEDVYRMGGHYDATKFDKMSNVSLFSFSASFTQKLLDIWVEKNSKEKIWRVR